MILKNTEEFRLSYELENMRVYVTLYGGFFHLHGGHSVVHSHNSYEFQMMLEGSVCLQTETQGHVLQAKEACIVAPNVVHSCILGKSQNMKTSFCFFFEKINKKSEQDLYGYFQKAFGQKQEIFNVPSAEKHIDLIKQILSEFYSDKRLSSTRLKNYFSLLLLNIAEDMVPKQDDDVQVLSEQVSPRSSETNLRRIMMEEYINQNYNKTISLKGLSKILYLSEKQTGRIFEKEFGIGFKQYLMKFRLSAAVYLLCYTNMSVSSIATEVGYQTYNGFYKLFFMQMGMSPEAYRKEHSALDV